MEDCGVGQGALADWDDSFLATTVPQAPEVPPPFTPPPCCLQSHPKWDTDMLFPCSWAWCHWLLDILFCIYWLIA